jgi:translation initiation factor 2B subunit (eIF-2B alpha/beta/delta family)
VGEIDHDATGEHLASEVPEASTVVVLGWPEVAVAALARRGDVTSLVVDAGGGGAGLAYRLQDIDIDAIEVDEAGMAAAVRAADLVVLEADALGPAGFVAVSGSYAAAAVARYARVPVWLVAGVGRVLPPGLWSRMARRLERGDPWTATDEIVPLELVDVVVRPSGRMPGPAISGPPDCPDAPELR